MSGRIRRVSDALNHGLTSLRLPRKASRQLPTSSAADRGSRTRSRSTHVNAYAAQPAEDPPPPILCDDKVDLLKRSWRDDFGTLYTLGTTIYEVIFDREPDAKMLFPNVTRHGEKWKESREFRAQALKFVQILALSIRNIHRPEMLNPILLDVGRSHVKFAERGFRMHHWDVFQTAIQVAMRQQLTHTDDLSSEEKQRAVLAWKSFVIYIVNEMKRGFQQEMATLESQQKNGVAEASPSLLRETEPKPKPRHKPKPKPEPKH